MAVRTLAGSTDHVPCGERAIPGCAGNRHSAPVTALRPSPVTRRMDDLPSGLHQPLEDGLDLLAAVSGAFRHGGLSWLAGSWLRPRPAPAIGWCPW